MVYMMRGIDSSKLEKNFKKKIKKKNFKFTHQLKFNI